MCGLKAKVQLRQVTKQTMGAVIAVGSLLQIPQVSDLLKSAVIKHPHLSSMLGVLITLAALIHNPQVLEALGIKIETATVVPLTKTPEP